MEFWELKQKRKDENNEKKQNKEEIKEKEIKDGNEVVAVGKDIRKKIIFKIKLYISITNSINPGIFDLQPICCHSDR